MESLITICNSAELALPEEVSLFCRDTSSFCSVLTLEKYANNVSLKQLLREWDQRKYYLSTDGGYYLQFLSRMACNIAIHVNSDFTVAKVKGYDPSIGYHMRRSLSELLMDIYRNKCVLSSGVLAHAAAIVYRGETVLFAGLPGAGKSTQANLWLTHVKGSWVLNYDHPAIMPYHGRYYVCGTPWSGKESCFIDQSIPLRAIVFVKQAASNQLRKLSPAETFATIYPNFMFVPLSEKIETQYIDVISKIAAIVDCFELSCTISKAAVDIVKNNLFSKEEDHHEDL